MVAGRFVDLTAIAEGGMGVVYRGRDERTGRTVALKRMLPTAPDVARFRREASVLARLTHPGIVAYVAHGEDDAGPWVAMEWAPGHDLDAHLSRARLPIEGALGIAVQVAEALSAVHALSIVHRDVKPANVIVTSESPIRVKLVDFGIALDPTASTKLTSTGGVLGTPLYMAPEQIRGAGIEARTDVHALGVMLFEMLTGRVPFEATSPIAVLGRILLEPAPKLEGVPEGVCELVQACLAKNPEERPSASSVVERLRAVALALTVTPQTGPTLDARTDIGLLHERRSAALLVARDVSLEDVARFRDVVGVSWDGTRDGLTFGLFLDERSPDTALMRAVYVALELGARGRVVVSAQRLEHGTAIAELFGRAAATEPASVGVFCDRATAPLLSRKVQVDVGEGPLARVCALEEDLEIGTASRTVGRDPERAQLDALLRGVLDEQRGAAAIVLGPAGQGKSRLSREARRAARTTFGVSVLTVEYDPLSASAPWSALGRALRRLSKDEAYDTMERRVLARIAPDRGGETAVALDRETFLDLLRSAMERTVWAASGALLVTLEDAHWADAATLRLLDELLARDDLPLAVIAFARVELDARFPDLFARRRPLRITLGPIGRRPSAELVRSLAPRMEPTTVDRIVELAGGSPLVVEELTRSWLASGTISSTSSSVSVFEGQLARLDPTERVVLRASAIVGEAFWPSCVMSMLGEVVPDVASVIARLEAEEIVVRRPSRIAGHDELRVRHALLREAAIEATPEDVRRVLHHAAVDWVGRVSNDPLLLAHHAERAGLGDVASKAYARAAAAAAQDLDASRGLYHRALALLPPSAPVDDRVRLLVALEQVERARGDAGERALHLETLGRLANDAGLERSLVLAIETRRATFAFDRREPGVAERALAIVDEARILGAHEVEGEALVLAALDFRDSKDPAAVLVVLDRKLPAASRARFSPEINAQIDRVLGILHRRRGDVDAALAAYESAARSAGDGSAVAASVLLSLGYLQLVQGFLADARATFMRVQATLDRLHARRDRARLIGNHAHLALALGQWSEARGRAREAAALHRTGVDRDAFVTSLCTAVHASLELGDLEDAARDLEEASTLLGGASYDEVYVGWLAGWLAERRGDADALGRIDATLAIAREARLVGFSTVLLAERARMLGARGRHDEAEADAREVFTLVSLPAGADFAIDALVRVRSLSMARPHLASEVARFVEERLARAKNEPLAANTHVVALQSLISA